MADPFENFFISILSLNETKKYKKIKSLYEPVLLSALQKLFPGIDKAKIQETIAALFEQLKKDGVKQTIDISRFEVILIGILFSGKIDSFRELMICRESKAMIRSLVSDQRQEFVEYYNINYTKCTQSPIDKLKHKLGTEEATKLVQRAYDHVLLTNRPADQNLLLKAVKLQIEKLIDNLSSPKLKPDFTTPRRIARWKRKMKLNADRQKKELAERKVDWRFRPAGKMEVMQTGSDRRERAPGRFKQGRLK